MLVRTIRAVRMPMRKLIGSGFADRQYFDGEVQVLPGHGVVEIYHDGLWAHLRNLTPELVALIVL